MKFVLFKFYLINITKQFNNLILQNNFNRFLL